MSPIKFILAVMLVVTPPSVSAAESVRDLSEQLFRAAHWGYMPIIVDLVQRGANVNYANPSRETAMHAAASRGHVQVIQYLRSRRANPNPLTVENWHPLHHAVRFGHANVANYLLANGAPLYMRTRTGQTVFDIATSTGDARMLNLLERYRNR